MKNVIQLVNLMVLLVILAGCSGLGAQSLGDTGQLVTIEGEIRSVDLSPMAADGPAQVELDSASHGRVLVLVAACFPECSRQAVELLSLLEPGLRVEARGEVVETDELAIYQDGVHTLQVIEG